MPGRMLGTNLVNPSLLLTGRRPQRVAQQMEGIAMVNSVAKRSTSAIKRLRCRDISKIAFAAFLVTAQFAVAKDLPPLPIPTAEQLQKGRDLLEKIAYVMENIPLTDEVAVMKAFGFVDLYTRDYPTNRYVQPVRKNGGNTLPAELAGAGLENISMNPWVRSPSVKWTAVLSGRFAIQDVCVSIDDVKRRFDSLSKKIRVEPVIKSHPIPEPKRLNDVPSLVFEGLPSNFSPFSKVSFAFEYQTCADRFTFIYEAN